jgi:inner membrane protein
VDFVTHAAVGALVGRAVAPRDAEPSRARRAALVGALVSVAPDADHVLEWVDAEAYLVNHRTATHSVVVLGAAVLVVAIWGGENRARRAVLGGLALASHLLLDVLTPFGTMLLWPFSDERYAADVLPIVCPWFTAASVLAAVIAVLAPARFGRPRLMACFGLAALGVFATFEGIVAERGRNAVVPMRQGLPDDGVFAVPDWRDPFSAIVIAPGRGARDLVRYRVGSDATPHRLDSRPRFRRAGEPADDDPAIWRAFDRADVKPLLAPFRVPVADADANEIVFSDLQYDAVEPGARPIVVSVPRGGGPPRVVHMAPGVQPLVYLLVIALSYLVSRRPATWR